MFYHYSIKVNRCKGSCNTINDPCAKICVPDQIKSKNIKLFNLMSRTNETRHIKSHKTCKCNCLLDASVTALNRGTSMYLTNLLGMFDILTQQEIAKGKPHICQSNCLNITINHC